MKKNRYIIVGLIILIVLFLVLGVVFYFKRDTLSSTLKLLDETKDILVIDTVNKTESKVLSVDLIVSLVKNSKSVKEKINVGEARYKLKFIDNEGKEILEIGYYPNLTNEMLKIPNYNVTLDYESASKLRETLDSYINDRKNITDLYDTVKINFRNVSDNQIVKTIDINEVGSIVEILSRGIKIEDTSNLTGEATYKMEMIDTDGSVMEVVELYDTDTDYQYVKYVNANTYYYVLVDTILSSIIVVDEVGY